LFTSETIIVVRARLTVDDGYFPAIWTTGPGEWPYGGEVDLIEYYGGRILANFAWGNGRRWGAKWHPFDNPNHDDKNKTFHLTPLPQIDTLLSPNKGKIGCNALNAILLTLHIPTLVWITSLIRSKGNFCHFPY
jgi:hypothetical protein